MAHIYDNVDLFWSWNGDFDWSEDGDLSDTSHDYLVSLQQDLHTIAASALQDWEIYPGLGAGLADYIGEPNTRAIADTIHDRLKMAIVSFGIVAEEDIQIKVVPVHIHKVFIVIKIDAIPTPWNSLTEGQTLTTQLLFDFMEQGVMFYPKTPDMGLVT